jgi:sugar fermentation stimulation protein A
MCANFMVYGKNDFMFSIELKENLEVGFFRRRLNRFMVEVNVGSETVLAHLPNSGRLVTVLIPNSKVFLRRRAGEQRKSCYDLFVVETLGLPVIVDTRFSNSATKIAIQHGLINSLKGCRVIGENVRVNNALLDFQLECDSKKFFLEVKSVTHVENGVAMFPDAPTLRGRKHLNSLMHLKKLGQHCGILFSVQRPDATILKPNYKIDPKFSGLLEEAIRKGVEIFTCTSVFKEPNKIEILPNLPKLSLK